jgi:hypothetical protein
MFNLIFIYFSTDLSLTAKSYQHNNESIRIAVELVMEQKQRGCL